MKHISVLPNLQTSKFWQKCCAQINFQILFYLEQIDTRIKTLKKYDLSKMMKDENLYIYWGGLIWHGGGWGTNGKAKEKISSHSLGQILISFAFGLIKRWSAGWDWVGWGDDWGGGVRRQRQGLFCRWEAVVTGWEAGQVLNCSPEAGCLSSKDLLCFSALLLFDKLISSWKKAEMPGIKQADLFGKARSLEAVS